MSDTKPLVVCEKADACHVKECDHIAPHEKLEECHRDVCHHRYLPRPVRCVEVEQCAVGGWRIKK